ncbi:MAG TPA: radical SAM protein [Chitinophagales bacterium]|nr:radical SAM protein [Chitinophagales bacterium]
MKITFVAIGAEQMGLSILSGIAKKLGHEVNLAFSSSLFHDRFNLEIPWLARFFDDRERVIRTIRETNPDVLVFSCLTSSYRWMLGIAEEAKNMNPEVKTIFGGVHVSGAPEYVIKNNCVDYMVIGEGELAFAPILNRIETGWNNNPIDNTWFRDNAGTVIKGPQKGFNQDLDSLAMDKTLWENDILVGDRYYYMTSRGCPYRCTFCFNNFFAELPDEKKSKGKYVRLKSVDSAINELLEGKKRYKNIRYIDFQDDVFTTDKEWLREFLPRYKNEIGVPFQCLTHPKYMDDDIAKWMSEAGCIWIQLGVQSMDEGFKSKNLKRFERSDHIRTALASMKKYGIKVKVDHMFGLPGEPVEAQEKAWSLYVEYVPSRIQTFWTCFLPGTELLREGIADGIVSKEEAERLNEGLDFYFFQNIDNIKDRDLIKTYKAYHFLFKIMPLLPKFIRMRLRAKHVKHIPTFITMPIAFMADLSLGMLSGNPDFDAYSRHYLFYLYVLLKRKLGFETNITRLNLRGGQPKRSPFMPTGSIFARQAAWQVPASKEA